MTLRLQIIIGCILLAAIILICKMIKKRVLDLRYALGWLCLLLASFVFNAFPDLVVGLSALMGIQMASNMVFFVGELFSVSLIFFLTVSVSKTAIRVERLTQEIGLIKRRLEEMDKEKAPGQEKQHEI